MKNNGSYMHADKEMGFNLNDDNSDDDDDSDAKQLFELPKRKIIRPPSSSSLKRKIGKSSCWLSIFKCCKICVTTVLPIVLAMFIVSMILCLTYLLVGISGMKNEIQLLKIRLNNVQDSEETSISRREQMRKSFQGKLDILEKHQDVLHDLQYNVGRITIRLNEINRTLLKLQKHPSFHLSSQLKDMVNDIDTLETGMAHTGAEINELKGNDKNILQEVISLKKQVKSTGTALFNITVVLSKLEHKPPPSLTTTPKTLVVTMMPNDLPVKRKELKKTLKELDKKVNKLCENEKLEIMKELNSFKNHTEDVNKAQREDILKLKKHLISILHTRLKDTSESTSISSSANYSSENTVKVLPSISTNKMTVLPSVPTPSVASTTILTKRPDQNDIMSATRSLNNLKTVQSTSVQKTTVSYNHTAMQPALIIPSNTLVQQATVSQSVEGIQPNVSTDGQQEASAKVAEKRSSDLEQVSNPDDTTNKKDDKEIDVPLENLDNSEIYNTMSTESIDNEQKNTPFNMDNEQENPLFDIDNRKKNYPFDRNNDQNSHSFDMGSKQKNPSFDRDEPWNKQGNPLYDMDDEQRDKYLKGLSHAELQELITHLKQRGNQDGDQNKYNRRKNSAFDDVMTRYGADGDDDFDK